jgi:hypothetical protein
MSRVRSFDGVTPAVLGRIREVGRRYGVQFTPDEGPAGEAIGRTPMGECVISYALDAGASRLTLVIRRKAALLPSAMLWRQLGEIIDACRDQDACRRA